MMTKLGAMIALTITAMTLAACNTTKTDVSSNNNVAPTGYWYLGDNGVRQWRTFNPDDVPPPAPAVRKNYASSVGNGSGRG